MNTVLEFREVERSYTARKPVLKGVSFSVGSGEVVALLGRNGAGKTTLIHIAVGMLFPHKGSVRAFGIAPTDDPVAVKKRIGYVAEEQIMPPSSSVGEMVALHRHLFPTWDQGLEKQLLQRFGLAGNTQKIRQLSKGQGRQLALICAICHRPELLILDEPGGGLDPAARREMLETSIRLLNDNGSAILFSSHYMGDVERLGGRVVLLDDGRVLVDQQLDNLREAHSMAVVPTASIRDLHVLERLPGCLRVRRAYDNVHAVFTAPPENVRELLRDNLGIADAHCVTLPLEELFIELVAGERMAAAT